MTTKWVEIDGTHHIIDHTVHRKNSHEALTLCSKVVENLYERTLGYNLESTPELKNTLCTQCLGVRDEGYVPSESTE